MWPIRSGLSAELPSGWVGPGRQAAAQSDYLDEHHLVRLSEPELGW